jgi:ankyrin repeat protein
MRLIFLAVSCVAAILTITGCAGPAVGSAVISGDVYSLAQTVNKDNVNSVQDGVTPLFTAVALNKTDVVKLLIDKGADVNLPIANGSTPLVTAITMAGDPIKKMLIDAGADVNKGSTQGVVPLMIALGMKQTVIARLLLDKGANVNYVSAAGDTPLMMATSGGDLMFSRLLLAKGAQPNVENTNGDTALSFVEQDNVELINLLTEKGANPQYRNKAGRDIAAQRQYRQEAMEKAKKPATALTRQRTVSQ